MPILAAIVAMAGAGCAPDARVAGPERRDACALLTGADVALVYGKESQRQLPTQRGEGDFWMSTCVYETERAGQVRTASLLVQPHHGAEGAGEAYADFVAALTAELGAGARPAPVEGLGEAAGWQDYGTSLGQLTVFDGPYQLILTASEAGETSQLVNTRRLAEQVLKRLHER